MPPKFGGETPLVPYSGPLTITLEAPTGTTEAAPVLQGELFKIAGTDADGSGYKAAALVAGDDPAEVVMVMALHRMTSIREGGFIVLSPAYKQIRRIPYVSGAAPTLGQSIEASTTNVRKMVGLAFANGKGRVMRINTADLDAEVLI